MTRRLHYVVYDCVVFAQALISSTGPARKCVSHARDGTVRLFVSEYVIAEIRDLDGKIPARYGVTSARIHDLADEISKFAVWVPSVPSVYQHPNDPDDSHYVDLAVATDSKLIVSRDRHLLNLMDGKRADAKEFAIQFPQIRVLTPDAFVQQLRAEAGKV